ncbi:MAG: redoxin domain-containing protein, partial [Planctomycetes bacterium]|nr:redoxin domain-containing protein [Planctomycetota bacterium]
EQAPDFTAAGSDGKTHALKDLAGQTVVLYFYPRDNTPGCTIEACEFRDHLARFKKAGAVVLGVSESPQRVLRWRRGLAGRKLDTEVCARQTVPQPNRVQSGVTMTIRYRKTLARRAAHFRQSRVMRWTAILPVMLAAWFATTIHAKPLGQATVTQINNDVRYKPGAGSERPAKRQDVVKGADTLRTGQKSQAELEFEDRTITRLGSNSTFTFDPQKREFELKKGLLLFDMPEGAGGGKIVTPAGTAAIEGTAGIISYRSAPKVICLAGKINVFSPSGKLTATILPGQLFIMGVTKYPVDFLLAGIQTGKLWGNGLPNNQAQFNKFRQDQLKKLKDGELEATPFTMIGEGLDVFVATSGQQFNPVIQDEASLGDQNNNIPEPTNPTT